MGRKQSGTWRVAVAIAWLCCGTSASPAMARITKEEQAKLLRVQQQLRQGGQLYARKDYQGSARVIKEVQRTLDALVKEGDRDFVEASLPLYGQLQRAHMLLKQRGVQLPALKIPDPKKAPRVRPKPTKKDGEDAPENPMPAGTTSFVKQVAPILVSKCGRCHIQNARGMVSMTDFETFMKGPEAGAVVLPKDAEGSRIIEVIEQGDMPRGGLKVTPQELSVLKTWIAEGAKYDGDDRKTALMTLAPGVRPSALPKVPERRATGKETVKFSVDIAPVLAAKCVGCHGGGDRPAARFDMMTYRGLLRGGENGPVIVAGKPAESQLIKKLKGTGGGDRMPQRQPPLPPETIAKIAKWIEEGATIDDGRATMSLRALAAMARAKRQTAEEVSDERKRIAVSNWKLAFPGVPHRSVDSQNFFVVGNVPEQQLTAVAKTAESVVVRIRTALKLPRKEPLVKGKITIFVVPGRYDYTEFGTMVQKREVPAEERVTGRYSVVDAYVVIRPPKEGEGDEDAEDAITRLLTRGVADVAVAAFGDAPSWFRNGLATLAAGKASKDAKQLKLLGRQGTQALASMPKATSLTRGELGPADSDAAAYVVADMLTSAPRRYRRLLQGMKQGLEFDAAFAASYGAKPEPWLDTVLGKKKNNPRR